MITFTIKILLAFSLKTPDRSKEKKKPNRSKDKKKRDRSKEKKKPDKTELQDPPYLFRLEKTCFAAHIEYELLPGKSRTYHIDVLCWRNAAKIFTADAIKILKPVNRNRVTFVPVCVEHRVKELSLDDLMGLRNAVIEFRVFIGKEKLGNGAKSNTTELIYIRETDVDKPGFVDGYLEKVNVSSSTKKSIRTKSDITEEDIASRGTGTQKNEAYARLKFPENFAEKLYEIIEYVCDNTVVRDQLWFTDFVRPCDPLGTQKPKEVYVKNKSSGKLILRMQGEIFFTDPNNAIFKLENQKSELGKIFVLPHVENLLTRFQKIHLNPIVIKMGSIQNFPAALLANTSLTDVYCKYTIPSIADCKSIEKPIGNTIKFMESHIFPTHMLSKIKLLEFLASRRFVVEVYGVQQHQHVQSNPKMFGEKPGDSDLSKINGRSRRTCLEAEDDSRARSILLAYCSYDLSSLLKNCWDFRAEEQLRTAESRIIFGNTPRLDINANHTCDFWTQHNITMNHINLAGTSSVNVSPLKDWVLMQNNTSLDIEAYLLSPQSAALVLHQIPNTYKRLLVIFFNGEEARQFLGKILRRNQSITCNGLEDGEELISGFIIDSGNNFAVYAEGKSVGYILNLWHDLERLTPEDAKVFFNTDQVYESRLYSTCNKWCGLYVINLKIPLNCILENQKMYVRGNVPLLCQKALIKLNLMFLTATIKSMFQEDLFPTIEELVSLDIEYGVPYAWQPFQQD